jgi:lambda family phage tail tape measure protein
MSNEIGTAKLSLTLDLADFNAKVAEGKGGISGFGNAAESAFNASNAKSKSAATSLARYAELIGKTADEAKLLRAQWAGVDVSVIDAARAKMAAVRAEQEANVIVAKDQADAWSAMQNKARAAYKELMSAQAEEKLLREANAAKALAQATELAAIKAQHAAQGLEFLSMKADAERVNRMRQAVSVFGASLDKLENDENQATNAGRNFIAMIREQEGAVVRNTAQIKTATSAVNQYGLSAKQQTAALRQVPAQITDIFVSLAGGQNPMMVLIQQGGQLKDVFGGVVPAAKALGAAVMGFINPMTIAAAVIATLAVAAYQGAQENNAYARSLAKTGDVAGITVGQMEVLAVQLSGVVGLEYKAAQALSAVAESGKFTGVQFGIVAEAAVRMESATGQSIDKTVEKFASLAQEPTAAVAKLNQETHFLTNEIFQQIKALEEQGRSQDAATVAMQAYADAVRERTQDVKQNLGILEAAWKNLGLGAKWAWDQMMDIGREDSRAERIRDLQAEILDIQQNTGPGFFQNRPDIAKVLIQQRRQEIGKLQDEYVNEQKAANRAAAQQEADDYAIQQDRNISAHRSADDKRAAEIARSRKEASLKAARAMTAGDKELAATIRANQEKYEAALNAEGRKKTGAGAARSLANAEASARLQEIKDRLTEEQAAISAATQVLQANYAARNVSAVDYYAAQRELIKRDTKAQADALEQQIAYLKSRDVAAKDSVNTLKQIGQLEAQLAKVRSEGATKLAVLGIQEQEVAEKRQRAIRAYQDALDRSTESAKRSADAALARIVLGEREAAQQEKLAAIIAEGADRRREIEREFDETNDREVYDAKIKALEEYMEEQVRISKEGYERMKAAQGDWLNGVKGGINNWMEQTSDVASQTRAITANALDGAADLMTDYFTTGKASWREYLADLGKQIVKFMAKQAIMKFLEYFAGWLGGGGSGGGIWSENTSTTGFGGTYAAKGGVFNGGAGLSAYSGSIVNQPTPFLFAKGAGIMGEAGPEAIMPLSRGSDGKLGVRMAGGGASVQLITSFTINSDGSKSKNESSEGEKANMYKQFQGEVNGMIEEKLNRAMMPGGQLWKAGVTQ